MCFANPEIIQVLNAIKPPYNINTLTQSTALDYLSREDKKIEWVAEIKKQREILKQALSNIGIIENIYPSDANFLLVKFKNAQRTYQDLVSLGIIVRNRSTIILCDNCLRITVGTEQENSQLIDVLNKL